MKKIFIFFIAALLAECPCPPIDTCAPMDCIYLSPARRCIKAENRQKRRIYCFLDFLYWEGIERGLEFALKNSASFFDRKIEIYEPGFGFNPAVRLGIGTHLPHDHWDLELNYTRYETRTSNHAQLSLAGNPQGGILSVWTSSVAFQGNNFSALWQDAEAKWKLHANLFDLFLKTRLCLSSALTFEPALGLKFALLQQRYKVVYQNGNIATHIQDLAPIQFMSSAIVMKNRTLNLGPSASFATRWNLLNDFDLIGSLSGALLATRMTIGRNESDVFQTGSLQFDSLYETNTYWTLRPQVAAALGLSWSHCMDRKGHVIDYGLSAAYEAQVWWKQNMLFRFIDQMNAAMIAPTQGDLFFHGLTLDAWIDF